MKEVGEIFRNKREEIGISIKEISKDLKIDEVLIDSLENGNVKAFKDILELKSVVSSLCKYLGVDEEEVLDDINDYMFEKTSKISLDDIKNNYNKEEKKIESPYTKEKKKDNTKVVLIVLVSIFVLLVVLYFGLRYFFIS